MQKIESPPVFSFLPTALFLAIVGWVGLFILIVYAPPTVWPRWMFFFLGVLAITGTVMPLVAFLNQRFPGKTPASAGIVVRQSLWVGIYVPTLAWLRIPRVLTVELAIVIGLGFILIEFLLLLRDHSQWKP